MTQDTSADLEVLLAALEALERIALNPPDDAAEAFRKSQEQAQLYYGRLKSVLGDFRASALGRSFSPYELVISTRFEDLFYPPEKTRIWLDSAQVAISNTRGKLGELSVVVQADAQPPEVVTQVGDTKTVFVVHGRNLKARDSVFQFLESIKLHPLEWTEAVQAAGKSSPFILEVLDAALEKAQAIIVLLTPDDEARLLPEFQQATDPEYERKLTQQARPNVLFEAGLAFGRSPQRVVIAQMGILRPFTDIAGIHVVNLSNDTTKRQDLAQRLKLAGCDVNLDGTHWHTAGELDIGKLSTTSTSAIATQTTADTLGEFLLEGRAIQIKCSKESEPAPQEEANDWAAKVTQYLQEKLGTAYVARFSNSAGLPMTANSISSIPHRNLWGGLHVRLARLGEFIQELSQKT